MTDLSPPSPLTAARRQNVNARRARVQQVLTDMQVDGSEITISSDAGRARVHRSFIHPHLDLRADVCAVAEQPAPPRDVRHVNPHTLKAENLNLREAIRRPAQHIFDLEARLSELLGEQAHTRTGLGAQRDHAVLQEQIHALQNEVQQLHAAVHERDDDLGAAREAQRQLMAQTNRAAT